MPPEPQTQPNVDVKPDAQPNTPTETAPQVTAPAAPAEPQAPPAQPAATQTPESQPAAPEAQPPVQETDVDLSDYYGLDQVPNLQDIDLTQLPVDEYGTVSLQDLQAALAEQRNIDLARARSEARQTLLEYESERRDVERVINKYPAVKEDKELFELVLDKRDAAALRGKRLSLTAAADAVFAKLTNSRQQGAEQANKNTTVQKAAHLSSSGAPTSGDEATERDLRAQLRSGDPQKVEAARHKLMRRMIRDGRIQISV